LSDETERTRALDDEAHLRNQKREWMVERCGRFLILGIVVAALVGLSGPGPLNHTEIISADTSLRTEHYSIQRYQAPAELIIRCSKQSSEPLRRLRISRSLIDHISVKAITPTPESVAIDGHDLVYTFHVTATEHGGLVVIRYENDTFGWVRYSVGLSDTETVSLAHFVCP
jgi:hypothetical protein